jgi:2-polyprenyl-3-methyl-5-hydroxy-6-metoxy-1,4-benzoquinol methylase
VTDLDRQGYWEERLRWGGERQGVGHAGLGEGFNWWLYRVRRSVFLRELRPLLPRESARLRVLDVGSGTGFCVERWHELGVAHLTGTDIAPVAVERLRRRFPADTFLRWDVGSQPQELDGLRFDAISAMDVVFHLVDDRAYERCFAHLHGLLEPGGLLVFSENFLHDRALRLPHQVSRTLAEIERVVTQSGFEMLRRRPLACLMNEPHDSRARIHRMWWRALAGIASRSEAMGAAAGALLYPLELTLVSRLREGPSTELMICRRRPSGPSRPAAQD